VRRLSDLARESLKQPGSWRCLEIVYRNDPRTLLDRFFLSSRSARGARSRLRVLEKEICKGVEQFARRHNPVKVISFGSGPGHEVLNAFESFKGSVAVEAICLDRETEALEYGRRLAVEKGLDKHTRYVQGNVLRMEPVATEYNIGVLSGLIDYFDFEAAVSILRMVRETLVPGGIVLVANMRRHPLASTMSALGNWNLAYREPEDVRDLLVQSGYSEIAVELEPEEVFCIGKGAKQG